MMSSTLFTKIPFSLALAFILLTFNAYATEAEDIARAVGVDEQLGKMLPLNDLKFKNEKGVDVNFKELIKKPTLLLLIFYSCPMTCNIMLGELSGVIQKMDLKLGDDYQIITTSFDDEDTPAVAMEKKQNYLHTLSDNPSEIASWTFLTGDVKNITALTKAVGFRFKKMETQNFIHPNVLIALSPEGKVIRYLYGPSFLPFDINMAVTEAARGTPEISIKKVLSYCFSYDSKSKKYVMNYTRLMATGMLILLAIFMFFLIRKSKKDR